MDIADFGFLQKRRIKQYIPRVELGSVILTGLPTSDDIANRVHLASK